jgi:hypothetical protein
MGFNWPSSVYRDAEDALKNVADFAGLSTNIASVNDEEGHVAVLGLFDKAIAS